MRQVQVLIVDDDRDFAEGMAMALEGYDCLVETISSGVEAVELFRKRSYDLVFMDVKLPNKNGVECFLEIKKFRPDVKVVMMTGYSLDHLLKQATDNGALRVLYKPLDIEEVLKIIQEQWPATVLIVDDDADFAESLQIALSRSGLQTEISRNGKDACDRISDNDIDVLILDVRMPEWNGLQVCMELCRRGCTIPTVVMTAYPSEEKSTIDRLKELGIDEVLVKPFDPNQLIQILGTINT